MTTAAIDIMGIAQTAQEESKCIICQESFCDSSQQTYEIPECKCKFHTNCIVTWFRCGSNRCPLCGNRGINNVGGDNDDCNRWWPVNETKLSIIRAYSKKKEAPKPLIQAFKKLNDIQEKRSLLSKEKTEFQQMIKDKAVNYAESRAKIRKFKRELWSYDRNIRKKKRDINDFPVHPIIIPTTVDMS